MLRWKEREGALVSVFAYFGLLLAGLMMDTTRAIAAVSGVGDCGCDCPIAAVGLGELGTDDCSPPTGPPLADLGVEGDPTGTASPAGTEGMGGRSCSALPDRFGCFFFCCGWRVSFLGDGWGCVGRRCIQYMRAVPVFGAQCPYYPACSRVCGGRMPVILRASLQCKTLFANRPK